MNLSLANIRQRLTGSGLMPRSRLAYFTLLMFGIELLLILIRWLILLFTRSGSGMEPTQAPLSGWIVFLTFVNAILLNALAVPWLRNTLMWRLRNRLIVTYLFIGVIPVGLIAAMVLLGGYLIASQFAISLASYDIHTEIDGLQEANALLAGRLADAARRGVSLAQPSVLQENLTALYKNFPGLQVTATFKGQTETFGARSTRPGSAPPAWIKGQYGGLVLEDDHTLHLRTVTLAPVGNDVLMVQASVPVDARELSRIGRNLGEIILARGRIVTNEEGTQNQAVIFDINSPEGKVRGGIVPDAINSLDLKVPLPILQFPSPIPIKNWQTGENESLMMTATTRLSVLYQRLFSTSSDYASLIRTALAGSAIVLALIEFVALIIGLRLTRTITRSVAALYQGTERVNQGDFRHRIQVKTRDQLAALETSFNSMITSLESLIAEQKEKQRLESELAIAQEVQGQLFPRLDQQIASFEVHGVCRPARTVSGDYYDFLPLGAERMGIAVGDISGKGISAALLMATVHSAVRVYEFGGVPERATLAAGTAAMATARHASGRAAVEVAPAVNGGAHSPSEVLWLLNRHLFHSTQPEKYATLFLGILDGANRRLTYSNAGHLPPMILSASGEVRRLEAGGTVIGLLENMPYVEKSVDLHAQDLFVAYSDGVTEPENEFGEFGEARLLEILQANRQLPLPRLSEMVTSAVLEWMGGAEQPDDVTLVLARVL
ncbi:MAG TPA: SpoIIE family protein phosphatase [Terriglobales bacterium]|jgi:sigma-B regulation protein RsbU (phosphoserine phosphatase)|nr:SpoIIE family protein phosphatase [Terriglobales bacterium]